MDVVRISAASIYDALKGMRQRRPLKDSPLLDLALTRSGGLDPAVAPSATERQQRLNDELSRIIGRQLAIQRGTDGAVTPGAISQAAEIEGLVADFRADSVLREAWSALYHRYLVNLRVTQIVEELPVSEFVLRERMTYGYELLAAALSDAEAVARLRFDGAMPVEAGGSGSTARASRARPPAPAGSRRHPGNVPVSLTSLIGRDVETDAVLGRFDRDGARIVTIVGPGGVGKTRLAQHVAACLAGEFEGGAWFVDLAQVEDPALVVDAVASTLGVRAAPRQPLVAGLVALLRMQPRLIVLDNFEHVLDAAPDVSSLLQAAPSARALVTSRELLDVNGESAYPLDPLAVPSRQQWSIPSAVARSPSVQLLFERVRARQGDFALTDANAAALAEICARLDGLPLAIELAATHLGRWSPHGLLQRIGTELAPLDGRRRDAAARQRTLDATIHWSYDRLSPSERLVFRCLGVFVGGCTAAAAQAVVDRDAELDIGSTLKRLVRASLVRETTGASGTRFRMLEPIRGFARARLEESGELPDVARRHADHQLAFVAEAAPQLKEREQALWLAAIDDDVDNVRAALRLLAGGADATPYVRLASSLWFYWQTRGHYVEGRQHLALATGLADGMPDDLRAAVHHAAGMLAADEAEFETARQHLEAALELGERLSLPLLMAQARTGLGTVAYGQGDFEEARRQHGHAAGIARALGDANMLSRALNNCGIAARHLHLMAEAEAELREALALTRTVGTPSVLAWCLNNVATLALATGNLDEARDRFDEALGIHRSLDNRGGVAFALNNLAVIAFEEADWTTAAAHQAEANALFREVGDRANLAYGTTGLAEDLVELGELDRAERLNDDATALYAEFDPTWGPAASRRCLARIAQRRLQVGAASRLYREAMDGFQAYGDEEAVLECLDGLAALATVRQPAVAAQLLGAIATLRPVLGVAWSPRTQQRHSLASSTVRSSLGEDGWAASYRQGTALSLAAAIALGQAVGDR